MSENRKLHFKKLPVDVQKQLLILNRRGQGHFVFHPPRSIMTWLCIIVPLIWVGYVLSAAQNVLWEAWMFWTYLSVSVAAAFFFVTGLIGLFASYASKFKDGYIFTPNEFIKIKDNCIQSWSLSEVESLSYEPVTKSFEVGLPGSDEIFKAKNPIDSRGLEENFNSWKLNATGNFLSPYEKPEYSYGSGGKTLRYAGAVVAAIAIAAGVVYSTKILNNNYDDELTWKNSSKDGTIKALDAYKLRHPSGRYVSNADEKIAAITGELKTKYSAGVHKSADPKAVASFTALLDALTKDPRMILYVRVVETREFDDSLIDKAKKLAGGQVYTYEQAMPSKNSDERKTLVFDKFKQAFADQFGSVDVSFERSDAPPDGSCVIDVSYAFSSNDGVYTLRTRSYDSYTYPGITFKYAFALRPAGGEVYETKLEDTPDRFGDIFRESDSGNFSFDRILFNATTNTFRNFIEAKFGFIDINEA